jgi:hypothetical protein
VGRRAAASAGAARMWLAVNSTGPRRQRPDYLLAG